MLQAKSKFNLCGINWHRNLSAITCERGSRWRLWLKKAKSSSGWLRIMVLNRFNPTHHSSLLMYYAIQHSSIVVVSAKIMALSVAYIACARNIMKDRNSSLKGASGYAENMPTLLRLVCAFIAL